MSHENRWQMMRKKYGIREQDVDVLFSLVDEKQDKINLNEFKKMLSIIERAPNNKKKMQRYTLKLDLKRKKCRFQGFKPSNFNAPADGILRCGHLDKFIENILSECMKQTHKNLTFLRVGSDGQLETSENLLEGNLERVVDVTNEQPKEGPQVGPVVFVAFHVSFRGDTHFSSIYHGRMQFDKDDHNQIKAFDYTAVVTKEDYQEISKKKSPVFEDWPEFNIMDSGWTEVSADEYAKVTNMEDDQNRQDFLVDRFFKSKFPPIMMAKPAFTVLALRRQFLALDKNGRFLFLLNEHIHQRAYVFLPTLRNRK
jgi:hypothetical protein